MKIYAAIQNEVPQEMITEIMGSVEMDGDTYYTRAFDSKEHLKTLCGTIQSRMELAGLEYNGAWILPHGTKVPTKKKFEAKGPLKVRDDYGVTKEAPQVLEMRPVYNKYYASEANSEMVMPPTPYYPNGLSMDDVRNHYASCANAIMRQYDTLNLDGSVSVRASDNLVIRGSNSQAIMDSRMDISAFDRLNDGNALEFYIHPNANTKLAWIEIEGDKDHPWMNTKGVAADLVRKMGSIEDVDVSCVELRFSGNNGFYVVAHFYGDIPLEEARQIMTRVAGDCAASESLHINCNMDRMRIVGSLAYPSGLACVNVYPERLDTFQKWMAKIPGVGVKAKLSPKYTHDQLLQAYITMDESELDSMEKWLDQEVTGALTSQDIDNILTLRYAKLGEINFVQLVSLLLNRDVDADTVYKWVHGLSVLKLMPKYASLKVKSDYADPAMGRTWQDYIKQYNFNPEVGDLNPTYVDPISPNTGREAMRWVTEMQNKVEPKALQGYIAATLGVWIPLEHLNEFIERMNKFIPNEKVASTDHMNMWTVIGMMFPVIKATQQLEWRFIMGPWKCAKCGETNPPSSKHSCPKCGADQETETVVALWRNKGSNDEWKEWTGDTNG